MKRTLELLAQLGRTVREFVEKAREQRHDYEARAFAQNNRLHTAVDVFRAATEGDVQAANLALHTNRQRLTSAHEKRKIRIRRARVTSRKMALGRIGEQEDIRKGELQQEMKRLDKALPEDLAAADTAVQEFTAELAELHVDLSDLDRAIQNAFAGYHHTLQRHPQTAEKPADPDAPPDGPLPVGAVRRQLEATRADLARFRKLPLPRLFRPVPSALMVTLIVAGHAVAAAVLRHRGMAPIPYGLLAGSTVVLLAIVIVLCWMGKGQVVPASAAVTSGFEKVQLLYNACVETSRTRYSRNRKEIEKVYAANSDEINQLWETTTDEAAALRRGIDKMIEDKQARVSVRNDKLLQRRIERLEQKHLATAQRLTGAADAKVRRLTRAGAAVGEELKAQYESGRKALDAEWRHAVQAIYDELEEIRATGAGLFPDWDPELWEARARPWTFPQAAQVGHLQVDVVALAGVSPEDGQLELPGPANFSLPAALTYPHQGSLLLETWGAARDQAAAALNNTIFRLLSTASPGKLSFTILDPVELGQNFAGIMHLADYEEALVNGRIWTQPRQIEQKLSELNDHMEKVIQMYLRNEYETIAEYNREAGDIAEKYHFLVIADFPANFSEIAAKRLLSIAASGARCGVFTLIHWDRRQALPQDFVPEDLRGNSVCITHKEGASRLTNTQLLGVNITLDAPPAPAFATQFLQEVGRESLNADQIQVPFQQVVPEEKDFWTYDTVEELRVAVGRTGATKLQYLALGKGTRQHALIAGKTGSGKSTLFHVLIANLSLCCSPDQVEFYLVDFKKGVEFKCYASRRLPHARVIAIESDREFGLSVLQRVDAELKRRGDMFRELGVQDLPGYRSAGGREPIPRTLLIIDEFQEFFVEDDQISQTASLLLDRIVRQGRAFGIHLLLGSQTLGGAYALPSTTMGQMVIRIALQCNEADAYLIMDDNNPAPHLLSRPGEAIYNDAAGRIEGNSPFQVVWLPDETREKYLDKVRELAERAAVNGPPTNVPIIFEGNAPADVRDNPNLRDLLAAPDLTRARPARIWLGAPNSIKGPTQVEFRGQSGNNLLVVGQRDEAELAMLAIALISLSAQYPRGAVRFILFDGTAPGSAERKFLEDLAGLLPHTVDLAKNSDAERVMGELAQAIRGRTDNEKASSEPDIYLLINGIQKHKKLRYEEEFGFSLDDTETPANPGQQLNDLICEGPGLGCHTICTCDTYNNVSRFLSRKAVSEFEMRVLFQMSPGDSASLMDSPKASKLGMHRAVFYNEQEGYAETFRPYSLPDAEWLESAAHALSRRVGEEPGIETA